MSLAELPPNTHAGPSGTGCQPWEREGTGAAAELGALHRAMRETRSNWRKADVIEPELKNFLTRITSADLSGTAVDVPSDRRAPSVPARPHDAHFGDGGGVAGRNAWLDTIEAWNRVADS